MRNRVNLWSSKEAGRSTQDLAEAKEAKEGKNGRLTGGACRWSRQIKDKRSVSFSFLFFLSLSSSLAATLLFGASLVPVTFHAEGALASAKYTWFSLRSHSSLN